MKVVCQDNYQTHSFYRLVGHPSILQLAMATSTLLEN